MRRLALLVLVAIGTGAGAARAQQTPPTGEVDVRIERDTRERASANELSLYFLVTLTDPATQAPPQLNYDVYGLVSNRDGGERSTDFTCEQLSDNDPTISRGVYYCPVFADHGGSLTFLTVVNKKKANPSDLAVTAASETFDFELVTNQVYTGGGPEKPKGDAGSVALLWAHVLSTGVWLLCAGSLAWLAIPQLRRRLSPFGLNRMERRLDLLNKTTWWSTGFVVGTGTFLLLKETAYDTPWSSSEVDRVFDLPYAQPYFLVLAAKLALYAVMLAALVPLTRGAGRQLAVTHREEEPAPRSGGTATAATGGGVGVIVSTPEEAPPVVERSSLLPGAAGVVMVAGLTGISFFVTLLKYFHQLIEAG